MGDLSLTNCRIDRRYDVVENLGRGSYAEIFVARDILASETSVHRTVVLKALNVSLQNDVDPELERTLVENFQNEAIALDRVRHPNVISRLGHGTARDLTGSVFHYIVLEFMRGGDLHRLVRQKPIGLRQALTFLEQVCAGLRHAHDSGVIHRDIKPQNLLLTKDLEVVKIADFGVARVHQGDSPVTRVGTNIYAPPEHSPFVTDRVGPQAMRLTPASDIYSLAKTFYSIVTGESPRFFTGSPITELPISVRNEEWADELKRVLLKATGDDADSRHQSVSEFWDDLTEVRRFAADFETATSIRPKLHAAPQAQVAMGYSPLAPQSPRFDTSRELRLKKEFAPAESPLRIDVERLPRTPAIQPKATARYDLQDQKDVPIEMVDAAAPLSTPAKPRRRVVRWSAFAAIILTLAGGLYATSVYLRGSSIVADFTRPFAAKTGTANTDINLRPAPSADNTPIGLVTKDSRVRIVKTQNNWYEVDVIQQGREREAPLASNHGWLYGRYVDLD